MRRCSGLPSGHPSVYGCSPLRLLCVLPLCSASFQRHTIPSAGLNIQREVAELSVCYQIDRGVLFIHFPCPTGRASALPTPLFNPEEKFVLRDNDPVANLHRWEFFAVCQFVCSGPADAQHLRYVWYRQHQGQIIVGFVAGFIHLHYPLHPAACTDTPPHPGTRCIRKSF